MADQINIVNIDQDINVFEESSQIINVIEISNNNVSIFEPANEHITVTDSNINVNINESEDKVVVIYEPGIRGPRGQDGNAGSGSSTIPDGTVSSSQQVLNYLPANLISSSFQIQSDISGSWYSFSSSIQQRVFFFENKTLFSSSQQLPPGLVSGSEQLTGSYDLRYHRLGTNLFSSSQQVQYSQISNIPNGIISSSQNFVLNTETSSFLKNEYSSSTDTKIQRLEQGTGSYALKSEISGAFSQISSSLQSRITVFENTNLFSSSQQVTFNQISNVPSGLISSSQQINTGSFSGSFSGNGNELTGIQTSSYSNSSSFSNYALSASYVPNVTLPSNLFSSSQQVQFNQISGLPTNLVSGSDQVSGSFELRGRNVVSSSQQISNLLPAGLVSGSEQLTGSYDQRYELKGSGLISSSVQVKNLLPDGTISGSTQLNSVFESKGTGIFSSSQQVQYSEITGVPSGLVSSSNDFISSSQQINQLLPNLVSSSQQINTGSFSGSFSGNGGNLTGIQSSSYALTASYASNAASVYTQTVGIRIVTQDVSIVEGSKGYRHIGFDSDIIKIRGVANTTGSINLNVKRNNLLIGNYQLSNQTGSIDTTLTNWTSSLNSNDLIEFYVSQSSTYITDLTFFMDLQSR